MVDRAVGGRARGLVILLGTVATVLLPSELGYRECAPPVVSAFAGETAANDSGVPSWWNDDELTAEEYVATRRGTRQHPCREPAWDRL